MKNLLVYINDRRTWHNQEYETLTKVQIDDALEWGWKPEDIILATNFEYTYRDIKSTIYPNQCKFHPHNNKIWVLAKLLEDGYDEVWFHDHDAFQVSPFTFPERVTHVGMVLYNDKKNKFNAGTMFCRGAASELLRETALIIKRRQCSEEVAMATIWGWPKWAKQFTILDTTYNIGVTNFEQRLAAATLPLKIVHFHPRNSGHWRKFCRTANPTGGKLVHDRLIDLLYKHGISGPV